MKKLIATLLTAAFLPAAVLFSQSTVAQEIQARNLKMAAASNKGHPQVQGAEKFAELVSQKSGGKINIKVFSGSALGPDIQVTSAMQGGTIDFNVGNASLLAGNVKAMAILDFPYTFNSSQEADAVLDGPFGKKLLDMLPARDLVGLGYFELGFRQMHTRNKAAAKADDLKGLKMRVIPTPIYVDFMNAIGANAISMPYTETYTALEQGAIDGMTNPLLNILDGKFNEVSKHLVMTNHMYTPQALYMSKKTWDKMSATEQKIIREAAAEAVIFQRKVARAEMAKALDEIKKSGMQVHELPPAEIAKLRERSKPVIEKFTKEIGADLVNELNAELAKARAKK